MQCCMVGCSGGPASGMQGFYNFPEDHRRKLLWLNAIGRTETEIDFLSSLCSSHFVEESFQFTSQGMLLKIDAVPARNIMKHETSEISNAAEERKHSIIVMSTAMIPIPKKRLQKRNDDLNQIEEQSQMNILEEIIKEYNSELVRKEHLYILESKPEKIKGKLDAIRSNGYNIFLRDKEELSAIADDNDRHSNEGFDWDTEDLKDNIFIAVEPNSNGVTEFRLPLSGNMDLQPESKEILQGTLQAVLDSQTSVESYLLIENIYENLEAEVSEMVIHEPKIKLEELPKVKRRKIRSRRTDIAPISETIEIHRLTCEQQIRRIKDALESNTFLKNPHRCYKCGISFGREYHHQQHMIRHNKSYGNYHCTICDSYHPKRGILYKHQLQRHLLLFRCKMCSYETTAREEAKMHTCGTDEQRTYDCKICQISFNNRKTYYYHNHRKHKVDTYSCSLCGKKFNNAKGLQVHHSICKRQVIECEACHRKFRDEHELRLHQQSNSHVCKRPELPQLDNYRCEECDLNIPTRRSYLFHMSTKHPKKANRIRCDECDKDFKSKFTYAMHMKMAIRHRKPESMRFHCEKCSALFIRKTELSAHMLRHTNERPLSCPICEKTFNQQSSFWQHKRWAHSGGKPRNHQCPHCELRYECNAKLEIHIRSHTAEKPFICDICGNSFYSNTLLTEHVKGVHLKILPKRNKRSKKNRIEESSSSITKPRVSTARVSTTKVPKTGAPSQIREIIDPSNGGVQYAALDIILED